LALTFEGEGFAGLAPTFEGEGFVGLAPTFEGEGIHTPPSPGGRELEGGGFSLTLT